jgi:hypothetical protein
VKVKNKRSSVFKWVAFGAIAASALLAAGAASARSSWSVQIGAGGYPAPYYAPPPPAYYPAPIYYAPPPGRIYYGPGYPYRPPNGDEWDNDREYEDRD